MRIVKLIIQGMPVLVACFFAATSDAAFTPPTTNLQAWFDAGSITGLSTGNNVTTWTDSSVNAHVATLTATDLTNGYHYPTYVASGINGLPAVLFSTSSSLQELFIDATPGTDKGPNNGYGVIPLPSGMTIAAVFQASAVGTANGIGGVPNFSHLIGDYSGSGVTSFGLENGNAAFLRYNGGYVNMTPGGPVLNTGTGQSLLVTETAVGVTNLYTNAGLVVSQAITPYNGTTNVSSISGGYNGNDGTFNGLIRELLIYNAPLSGSDLTQLRDYLANESLAPEPASVTLLGIGGLLLFRRRRK